MKNALRLSLCLWLLAVSPLQADDIDRDLTQARGVFLQAVDGDRRAVRTATRRFKALSHQYSQEPVLLAYYGACLTLQGRDAPSNLDKRRLTESGLRKIDRALALLPEASGPGAPHTLDTLLVAANAYIHIPAFFNRHDRGRELLRQILADRGFDAMAPGFRAATYIAAALVAHGEGDDGAYRRYLELTVSTDPEGRNGRLARGMIEEL